MKFKPNENHTTIAIYAFLVIIAAILFFQAITNLSILFKAGEAIFGFIQPIIFGFIIAFLLNPLLRTFETRVLRMRMKPAHRRALGLLLTYVVTFVVLGLFFRLVIPQLILSLESLFPTLQKYVELLNNFYNEIARGMADFHLNSNTDLTILLNNLRDNTINSLNDFLLSLPNMVANWIPEVFSAGARFTGSLIDILLGLIISIYFLADREKLFAQTKKITQALFSERTCQLFYDIALDANRVFSGFIIGKIIDSAIIGVLCFALMSLFQMPYTVLISVIVGVTNVIPYFGPFFGAIPSALIILIVDPMQALGFSVMILALQQFDGNILGPKILGDTTGLSALWVIFAIMLFSGLFGVLGMFIGVPLFALIYTLVRRLISYLLQRKGLPVDTRDYDSELNPLIK